LVMIDFQIAPLLGESGVITELIASAVVIEDRVRIYDELQQLAEELEQRVDRRTSELKATAERLTEEMRQREMMQAALIQSQKLEAIGQLTAGIAHDFNNAIAAIAGGYDLITRRTDNPQILEIAEHGKKAAHRGAKLVQHLLAFSRQQPLASTNTDVGQLLREIEPLLRHSIGPHITMTVTEPADLPRVFVDPVQLESVMINLAINARDAMGDGGVLEIRIEPCLADAPRRPTELGSRDAIGIHFCDNGTGMTPEVLARVIEPFFTTKPMGLGTGLGLAMVHGFALQSEGALSITSKVG
jgi:C4-dicarboxylate-specific signal transduction histidine kinase